MFSYETIVELSGISGLIYAMILFFAVMVYALWPKNQDKFDHAARIPLDEE